MVKIPEERVFRVSTAEGRTLYVRTQSEAVARNLVARRGLRATSVLWVGETEIPDGAEVLVAPPPRELGVSDIAKSELIQHPVRTIALGVFLGLLATWLFFIVLGAMFGGTVRLFGG